MFTDYQRILLLTVIATAAIVSFTLSAILPASIASVIGYFAGLSFASRDKVNKEFITHADGFLQEDNIKEKAVHLTMLGAAITLTLSYILLPYIASMLGLMIMMYLIFRMVQ